MDPLVDKAQRLSAALDQARLKLRAQDQSVGELRQRLQEMGRRAADLNEKLDRPQPPPPAPAAALVALGWSAPPRQNRPWAIPCLLLLAAAVGFSRPSRPDPAPSEPAPIIRSAAAPAPAEPVISLSDDSDAVLELVFHYRLPGSRGTILNRMKYKNEGFVMSEPWVIKPLDEGRYLVSYHPLGEPAYEFEADLARKTVSLSPETAQLLAAR